MDGGFEGGYCEAMVEMTVRMCVQGAAQVVWKYRTVRVDGGREVRWEVKAASVGTSVRVDMVGGGGWDELRFEWERMEDGRSLTERRSVGGEVKIDVCRRRKDIGGAYQILISFFVIQITVRSRGMLHTGTHAAEANLVLDIHIVIS